MRTGPRGPKLARYGDRVSKMRVNLPLRLALHWGVLLFGFSTWMTWMMFFRWDLEVLPWHRYLGFGLLLSLGAGWLATLLPGGPARSSEQTAVASQLWNRLIAALEHPDKDRQANLDLYRLAGSGTHWVSLLLFSVLALSELPTIVHTGLLPATTPVQLILEIHRYANAIVPAFTLLAGFVYALGLPALSLKPRYRVADFLHHVHLPRLTH